MKYMADSEREGGKYFLMGAAVAAGVYFFMDVSDTLKNAFGFLAMALGIIYGDIKILDRARKQDFNRLHDRIANLEEQLERLRNRD